MQVTDIDTLYRPTNKNTNINNGSLQKFRTSETFLQMDWLFGSESFCLDAKAEFSHMLV